MENSENRTFELFDGGADGGTYDNGTISVFVPNGWKAFNGIDPEGNETPKKVFVYQGIHAQTDVFTHAGVYICFYGEDDCFFTTRDFYSGVREIESFTLGRHRWNGYTCTSLGYPYLMLESTGAPYTLLVMILTENGEHRISFDEPDVQRIVESIAPGKYNASSQHK